MLKNYLTSIWRYVSRNKTFTMINLFGLVIGMTAFLLIVQYVNHELGYDQFWRNTERVYRVQLDRYNKGERTTRWAAGAAGIGPDLKANFPEVELFVRMRPAGALLSHGDVFFREEGVYYASQDFFRVFGYPLSGEPDSVALKGPNKIVLSRSMARKYFGDEDPIGKTLRNNGRVDLMVTGIFDDIPAHSHVKVDALVSLATFVKQMGRTDESEITQWYWDGFLTYILLHRNARAAELEAKLPAFVDEREGANLKQRNEGMVFHLQSISDIHLDSDFIMEFKPNGSRDTAYFLSVIAVLIILIAWINYINLSTAKSVERAREVGVRKVMGGFRWQLIQQFLVESLLLNCLAVGAAIMAVMALTSWFSELTGRELGFGLFRKPTFWLGGAGLVMVGAILSGLYPAFVLSSYKPVDVLKGRFKNTNRGVHFRKGMVVLQFMASVILIVGTYTVYRQISYMRNQKLGVNIDQTVVLKSPNITDSTYESKFEAFKEAVMQYPKVSSVSASTSVPGERPGWNAGGIRRLSQREEEANQYRVVMMDHDFISSFGLEVLAGRGFEDRPGESANVLLNESAARLMGFTDLEKAIDDQIFFWGDTFRIAGVVKNYRQESLKKAFDPLVFRYDPAPGGFYSIKFDPSGVRESLANFEAEWKELFPGNPFDYFFLDDFYDRQYKADQQFGKAFGLFSALAMFIACLGLFGLSSLTAIQRTKEIGVRKVLGASVSSILTLVGKDYLVLMGVAIVLATPIAWWVMNNWLEDFASRISLSWGVFALPSLAVVIVALCAVSIHTFRAARTNPARSLRYE